VGDLVIICEPTYWPSLRETLDDLVRYYGGPAAFRAALTLWPLWPFQRIIRRRWPELRSEGEWIDLLQAGGCDVLHRERTYVGGPVRGSNVIIVARVVRESGELAAKGDSCLP